LSSSSIMRQTKNSRRKSIQSKSSRLEQGQGPPFSKPHHLAN
jgi:hypothetical protein